MPFCSCEIYKSVGVSAYGIASAELKEILIIF